MIMAIQLPRAHAVRLSLAAAAVAALALVPTVSASASGAPAPSAPQPSAGSGDGHRQADANKALVIYFNDQLFNDGNFSVIDKYVSPTYIQHNPTVANGPAALRQLVTTVRSLFPHLKTTTVRAVAEGDLVFIENYLVSVPGARGNANFDIYRVEGGKLVEHWDVLQAEPATTVSGNDMLSQLSSPAGDGAPASTTTRDKAIVLNYLTALTQDHELSAVDQYVAPSLYQHDPTLADGSAALKQAYASLFAQYPAYSISIAQVAAEGDLVAVHAHVRNAPSDLGQAVVYLYRVQHGKIVEQWDSVQAVPATSANDNTMF
jgi:predicted SnoaL-like aldol condensation-catalyzing enzyme